MKYKISHTTRYQYADAAALSHNQLFLVPRNTLFQKCLESTITFAPNASSTSRRNDYFGNTTTIATIEAPHTELEIAAKSFVSLSAPPPVMPEQTPAWELAKEAVWKHATPEDLDAFQFVFASPMIVTDAKYALWAQDLFLPGAPVLQAALGLIQRIFSEFTYDPQATTTTTPMAKAFDMKRGVCQDFAHIAIACLRSLGLPARYVSGYLHTLPPPGKSKLIGADASHAWLSFFIPGTGWVDLDPTNNLIAGDQHLTLAWGRDYSDVTPVKGTVLGGGQHQLSVTVDVSVA
jgi:transglutaminase-like putative cysteine protease